MYNPFDVIDERLERIENFLAILTNQSTNGKSQNDITEFLTVEQTAEFLSLSIPTIYGLISKKELPVMKRGKRCYFDKTELVAYLKAGRKKTKAEIKAKAENHFVKNTK
ncbi:MAG: helix-turn-helix domain-containing protein [Chitinophagales bacterium]|nr:helix-turn-helix domain-containing protein [Chitinophagales bacterium]